MYSEFEGRDEGAFESPTAPAEAGNVEPLFLIEESQTSENQVQKTARASYEGVHLIVTPVDDEMTAFDVVFVGSNEAGGPDINNVLNSQRVEAQGQWFQEVAGVYAHRLKGGVPVERMFANDEGNIQSQIDSLRQQLDNLS